MSGNYAGHLLKWYTRRMMYRVRFHLPLIMAPTTTVLLNLVSLGFNASSSVYPFNPGFNISAVADVAKALPKHSWEYGTAVEALLEIYSPHLSFEIGEHGLANGNGAVGDPASLGVAAQMVSPFNATIATALQEDLDYIINEAPRWPNGAISHRFDVPELWDDFIYMAPPTIAYVGASTNNASLLKLAYEQCGLYREVNLFSSNSSTPSPLNTSPTNGLWHHIVGPQSGDPGLWATGNGWAAGGMTRVLATIMKAPAAHDAPWRASALADLSGWIKEIIDGARAAPLDNGLLRNYLDDTSPTHGYGEISGSTMLASVAYRMVILDPEAFPAATYVAWADSIRAVISGTDALGSPHVTSTGIVAPAVDPLWWQSPTPWTAGSPEGNNFVVLMYAAWRDCVFAGLCTAPESKSHNHVRHRQHIH
ncbi:hypothetical protein C8J57DRAFT_1475386 [Mycena rebaudengoi]|nr:hypothetical protein C8J57DRAFT_1475386 [Mycena rebaudengoi]